MQSKWINRNMLIIGIMLEVVSSILCIMMLDIYGLTDWRLRSTGIIDFLAILMIIQAKHVERERTIRWFGSAGETWMCVLRWVFLIGAAINVLMKAGGTIALLLIS